VFNSVQILTTSPIGMSLADDVPGEIVLQIRLVDTAPVTFFGLADGNLVVAEHVPFTYEVGGGEDEEYAQVTVQRVDPCDYRVVLSSGVVFDVDVVESDEGY